MTTAALRQLPAHLALQVTLHAGAAWSGVWVASPSAFPWAAGLLVAPAALLLVWAAELLAEPGPAPAAPDPPAVGPAPVVLAGAALAGLALALWAGPLPALAGAAYLALRWAGWRWPARSPWVHTAIQGTARWLLFLMGLGLHPEVWSRTAWVGLAPAVVLLVADGLARTDPADWIGIESARAGLLGGLALLVLCGLFLPAGPGDSGAAAVYLMGLITGLQAAFNRACDGEPGSLRQLEERLRLSMPVADAAVIAAAAGLLAGLPALALLAPTWWLSRNRRRAGRTVVPL